MQYGGDNGVNPLLTQKAIVKINGGKKHVKLLRVPSVNMVTFCTLFFLFYWFCFLLDSKHGLGP